MPDELTLAAGFDHVSVDQWRAAVEEALRGKPVGSLVTTLAEGIDVAPLATADDAPQGTALARATAGPWGIRVVAQHPDPAAANAILLDDLEKGASQVHVRLDAATRSGTGDDRGIDGVAVADDAALATLLDGVLFDLAPVSLDAGASYLAAGRALMALSAEVGEGLAGLRLGADPIGSLAATGTLPQGMEQALAGLATLAVEAHGAPGDVRAVAVDTAPYHDAGATEELDLAVAVATGVAYLRHMVDAGLAVADAAAQIEFRLPVGVDQFLAIAKLRAFRRLWSRVLAAAAAEPVPALVHASLGSSLVTRRDPWVNMLRGTIACFSAAVGGADSVTVPSLDSALGLPSDLGRRMGRNTQLVLQREGHVGRVADPGAGSWYLERLTDDLAHQAWTTFQAIEKEGGMVAALVDGHVHDGLARRRLDRDARVATRRRPITGVSEFPLLDERVPAVDPAEDVVGDHLVASAFLPEEGPGWTHVEPLVPAPVAGPFEDLRDAAEAADPRPRILSVNLGPLARHTARATFAANLFAAGGIEAVATDGFDDPADAVAALSDAGTTLAVVCGDDEQYAQDGAAFVAALKDAGATVWVAGRPHDALGADGFVHLGCDVLAQLGAAHRAAGVAGSEQGSAA